MPESDVDAPLAFLTPLWRIVLLGGLRVERGTESITRFRSHNIAGLLAYLALSPGKAYAREPLAERFWPDAELGVARANLRTALASLRRQLEPPGVPVGSVLVAQGASVTLAATMVTVDIEDFARAMRHAARPGMPPHDRMRWLREAVALYRGPLLPGFYEDDFLAERDRLAEQHAEALRCLVTLHDQTGDSAAALDCARKILTVDPLAEEAHATVIRLLMATDQERAAQRQFQELNRLLQQEWGAEPSPETRRLLQSPRRPREAPAVATPAAQLASVGVPASPVTALSPSLPLTLNRFFGREDELSQITGAFGEDTDRLLTLTGPGGTGKTRLATEAAHHLARRFSGGIRFVPLADLLDGSRLFESIARSLGLPPTNAAKAPDQVIAALTDQTAAGSVLLVLDNFEQIVESGAEAVRTLLERVRGVSCLVTSRQCLLLEGEREFPVAPLPTPRHSGTPERLMEFASVQLFVSRAQAIRSDFQLSAHNADAITALCARLDGIPLAIELCAAWAQTLTPSQMLSRLERRFDLLVTRRRDAPGRHAALRTTIDWSYQLLTPDLQRFFACLSVFRGGWSLSAAESVCGEPRALHFLAELCERSLIVAEESRDLTGMRYRMLESLREFAAECLGSDGEALFRQHTRCFAEFAGEAAGHLSGPQQVVWLNRLEEEQENLRAVFARLTKSKSPEDRAENLRLAASLTRFWMVRGHLTEGRRHLAMALANADESVPGAVRVSALAAAGHLAGAQGDRDAAQRHLEACQTQAGEIGDSAARAQAVSGLGNLANQRGDFAGSKALFGEALSLYEQTDNTRGAARILMMLGNVGNMETDFAAARAYYERSLALSRKLEDAQGIALVYQNLGVVASRDGDHRGAVHWFEQSLAIRRELNDLPGLAATLETLGTANRELGNTDAAQHYYEESLALRRQMHDDAGTALLRLNLALAAIDQKTPDEAETQIREGLRLLRASGNTRYLPYVLETSASAAALRKDGERAARLWGAAESARAALQAPSTRAEIAARAVQKEAVCLSLPEGRFEATFAEGQKLGLEEALGGI